TSWDGKVLGEIPVEFSNIWKEYSADIAIPDGVQSLYFTYKGDGSAHLGSFTLES
ncbi:MAG: alpha-N-arabinofuranosidase, partial [Halanaerobiaceae bacterium]